MIQIKLILQGRDRLSDREQTCSCEKGGEGGTN